MNIFSELMTRVFRKRNFLNVIKSLINALQEKDTVNSCECAFLRTYY